MPCWSLRRKHSRGNTKGFTSMGYISVAHSDRIRWPGLPLGAGALRAERCFCGNRATNFFKKSGIFCGWIFSPIAHLRPIRNRVGIRTPERPLLRFQQHVIRICPATLRGAIRPLPLAEVAVFGLQRFFIYCAMYLRSLMFRLFIFLCVVYQHFNSEATAKNASSAQIHCAVKSKPLYLAVPK